MTRSPLQLKVSEKDAQRAILDYLAAKRIFHYRNNSGAFVMPETATTKRRFFRAGVSGAPDIVAVVKGTYVGIEVKASDGRQSDDQKQFQEDLERAGGIYVLARGIDEVETALKKPLSTTT